MVWYTSGTFRSVGLNPLAGVMTSGGSGSGDGRITVTSTLRDRTPAPQGTPLAEAQVIWGRAASFSWGSTSRNRSPDPLIYNPGSGGGGVTWPDPDEPQNSLPVEEVWEEVGRVERTVRITGTNGAYVDFRRISEITWRLPNLPSGQRHFVTQRLKKFGDE